MAKPRWDPPNGLRKEIPGIPITDTQNTGNKHKRVRMYHCQKSCNEWKARWKSNTSDALTAEERTGWDLDEEEGTSGFSDIQQVILDWSYFI